MKSKNPTDSESYQGEDPVRPMMHLVKEVIPKMEKQQRSLIKFSKSCYKALEKFNKDIMNMDSEIKESRDYYQSIIIGPPPVRPMYPFFVEKMPAFEIQQKKIMTLVKGIAKEAVALLDELDRIDSGTESLPEK